MVVRTALETALASTLEDAGLPFTERVLSVDSVVAEYEKYGLLSDEQIARMPEILQGLAISLRKKKSVPDFDIPLVTSVVTNELGVELLYRLWPSATAVMELQASPFNNLHDLSDLLIKTGDYCHEQISISAGHAENPLVDKQTALGARVLKGLIEHQRKQNGETLDDVERAVFDELSSTKKMRGFELYASPDEIVIERGYGLPKGFLAGLTHPVVDASEIARQIVDYFKHLEYREK